MNAAAIIREEGKNDDSGGSGEESGDFGEATTMRTRSSSCASCGAPDEGQLLHCSGCHLVEYCSQDCQRRHWREGGHKQTCKIARDFPKGSTKIVLDAGQRGDFNSILSFAGTHLKSSLKFVEITIGQEYLLRDPDLGYLGPPFDEAPDGGRLDRSLEFDAKHLKQFLKTTNLCSLSVRFDDCCWGPVRKVTKKGKAFLPLAQHINLQKLEVLFGCFAHVEDLCGMLPSNLKSLRLDMLTLKPISITIVVFALGLVLRFHD